MYSNVDSILLIICIIFSLFFGSLWNSGEISESISVCFHFNSYVHCLFLFTVVVSKFLERSLVDPKYLCIIRSDIYLANIVGLNLRKLSFRNGIQGFLI